MAADRQIFWDAAVLQALSRGESEATALDLADRLLVARDARSLEAANRYEVTLKSMGDRKIQTIKVLRELSGLGLADAKNLAESAPVVIANGVDQETAHRMRALLTEVGATVQIVLEETTGPTPWERLLKPSVFDS